MKKDVEDARKKLNEIREAVVRDFNLDDDEAQAIIMKTIYDMMDDDDKKEIEDAILKMCIEDAFSEDIL